MQPSQTFSYRRHLPLGDAARVHALHIIFAQPFCSEVKVTFIVAGNFINSYSMIHHIELTQCNTI